MIELDDFSKEYRIGFKKVKVAASHISFNANKGEVTGLLGPNGAGKTTIIKAICAEHYPTSGNVYVYNKDFVKTNTAENPEYVHSIIGYVSEMPSLYNDFTVKEFINTIASLRLFKTDNIKIAIEKVIELCSLGDVLKQKISSLSKGYKQRVNFAQGLIHNPPILVLDEPAAGLDPAQIHQMRNFIKTLSTNKTVLMSTHIMAEAEALCNTIFIISKGTLVAKGSSESIKKQTKTLSLEEAFLKLTEKNNMDVTNEK